MRTLSADRFPPTHCYNHSDSSPYYQDYDRRASGTTSGLCPHHVFGVIRYGGCSLIEGTSFDFMS
jgi:hypothetical protein